MEHEPEAEQWKVKARRAEVQAAKTEKSGDMVGAAIWRETARIYWELAARREAWEKAWVPRLRPKRPAKDSDSEPR